MYTIKSFCTEQNQTDYRISTKEYQSYLSCKIYCSGKGGYFHGSVDLRSATEYFLSPSGKVNDKQRSGTDTIRSHILPSKGLKCFGL